MFQKLLSILPLDLSGPAAFVVGGVGVFFGAALWLSGARYSRSITTLAGVAVGTLLGMHLPAWFGWSVDGTGPAVGGAILLGVAGYLFHTTAVGVFLGSALGLGACWTAWAVLAGDAQWTVPAIDWSSEAHAVLATVWRSMPGGDLPRAMPVALAGGLTAGVVMTVLWPKAARSLAFSLIGVLLVGGGGALALRSARPQWLEALPADPLVCGLLLALPVAVGAAVQWAMLPKQTNPVVVAAKKPDAIKDVGKAPTTPQPKPAGARVRPAAAAEPAKAPAAPLAAAEVAV